MASRKIMTAIKRAVSPVRQATGADLQLPQPIPTGLPATTPFTRYVLDNLNIQNGEHKMFAMTFAPQIKMDCNAKVLDFDDYHHLLGHANKASALRTLLRTIPRDELVFNKDVENSMGRPRDVYMLDVNQIEEVLLAANTEEGRRWRKLVLKIKNLVVQFMRMEMEEASKIAMEEKRLAQQQLEEETSKRLELEAVQSKLQATIESQRKRDEKKEARKRQQKEPLETAYIMTNMPDDHQGPYKCGKTGGDAKKRAQDMQTGNHEEMRVVASAKCVDSKLVEDVMHRIFWDYRTNDKLEWFDARLESLESVQKFVVEMIDGLNRVDHDEFSVEIHLNTVSAMMRDKVLRLPSHIHVESSTETERVANVTSNLSPLQTPSLSPIDSWVIHEIESQTIPGVLTATELLGRFNSWGNVHLPEFETMTSTAFGLALKSLKRRGLRKKVEKAATYYHLDLPTLRENLIADGKLNSEYFDDMSNA